VVSVLSSATKLSASQKAYVTGEIMNKYQNHKFKCQWTSHYQFIHKNLFQIYQQKLVLLWAQLTKIYPLLPTSVQLISITKTLPIVPTKNERDPPLFTGKLLIKFQNILRNTTQVIRHRVKILFSVISSPITLEWQKWKSSEKRQKWKVSSLLSSPVNSW
jgi:hypothetical protein